MVIPTPKNLLDLIQLGGAGHAAIVSPDAEVRITYSQLVANVQTVAGSLRAAGIRPGDRVATALPNGIASIVTFLAGSMVGTSAPLNPSYTETEFRFYLQDTNARVLLCPPDGLPEARRAAVGHMNVLSVNTGPDGWVSLVDTPAGPGHLQPSGEDVALVLHTSGSTGRPKRVPLSHFNLATSAGNIANTYGLSASDTALCAMPLFHVHGIVASTLSTLLTGGTVIVPSRFNPLAFWRIVRDYGVTWYSGSPAIHRLLLMRAQRDLASYTRTLRFIRSCSAPLTPETMHDIEERFGAPVLEAYGMTEASHQMCSNPLPPQFRKPGSVGLPTGIRVAIMDGKGGFLPPGVPGEVFIQGPTVTAGYEDNPDANSRSFVNGWFRTGDQGVLDDGGYLRLTGRLSELINRGGEKIAPREIDEVLLTHPDVLEAITFGIADPTWGEEVVAAVVLRQTNDSRKVLSYCHEKLADFKCPKKLYIVDEIPKTSTGKVKRGAVAKAFAGQSA